MRVTMGSLCGVAGRSSEDLQVVRALAGVLPAETALILGQATRYPTGELFTEQHHSTQIGLRFRACQIQSRSSCGQRSWGPT